MKRSFCSDLLPPTLAYHPARHAMVSGPAAIGRHVGQLAADAKRRTAEPELPAAGFSLLELVISLVVSSVLLLGLGSALSIATHSVRPDSSLSATLEAAHALQQLQDDLRFSTRILNFTPQLMDMITTDSDADGREDRVRYRWSGLRGDPLERRWNDGAWYTVCNAVTQLQLDPHYQSSPEKYVTPPTVGPIELLDQYTSESGVASITVNSSSPVGQFIHPDRFSSAPVLLPTQQWLLTSLDVYSGCTTWFPWSKSNLVVCTATQDGLPTQKYLHTEQFDPVIFYGGRWKSFQFAGLPWLGASDGVHVGMSFQSGWNALNIVHSTAAGDGFATTAGSSSTDWQRPAASRSLLFRAYGRRRTWPHTETESARFRYQFADVSLGCTSLSQGPLHAAVPFVNQPWRQQLLADTDFSTVPTSADVNFDGVPDLVSVPSSTPAVTPLETLTGGTLQLSETGYRLATGLPRGKNADVRLRMRQSQASSGGPVLRIITEAVPQSTRLSVMVSLQKEADGTHTLNLYEETDTNAFSLLNTWRRLDGGFLDVRVLMNVTPRSGALWVNGILIDSFRLTPLNASGLAPTVQFQALQSTAEFDAFSVICRDP